MLEIRNLTKVYKSKGGVITKALDGVSIKFPSKGLVFLLGKSGSGKSTLLNVTGGLDKPDDGEIIIKGRNSKSFSSSDFDSYRNTFIGFIFQEYNILNEFNVEQNISLALQLQGKKNDKEAVDKILEEVDLKGFGKRKPNTLSGGQKQRIAIARALIKNPEIIMADEPTGALDSTTGKQVFDTLKKLSSEKLIIVVSHDRDFAEIYGDRIIELSDGKVISDVTKEIRQSKKVTSNIEIVNENIISIKNGNEMTKEEFDKLYSLLKDKDGEILISKGDKQIPLMKQVAHIRGDNQSEVFNKTEEVELQEYDGSKTKFIKSRLPFKRAFKMGSSSLKSKPIRMLFTIFLTIVALTMFGVASTLLFYDSTYSISTGLEQSVNDYEALVKAYDRYYHTDIYDKDTLKLTDDSYAYKTSEGTGMFTINEINEMNSNSVGHYFVGAYGTSGGSMYFPEANLYATTYYRLRNFTGFIDAKEEELEKCNVRLALGEAPTKVDEIAISQFVAESLMTVDASINTIADLIGKEYNTCISYSNSYTGPIKITGIYDCGQIPTKYQTLKDVKNNELENEFEYYLRYSYHAYVYVCKEFHDYYGFKKTVYSPYMDVKAYGSIHSSLDSYYSKSETFDFMPAEFAKDLLKDYTFYDLNGEVMEYREPNNNEIYITRNTYYKGESYNRRNLAKRCADMIEMSDYSITLNDFLTDSRKEEYRNKINDLYSYDDYSAPSAYKKIYDELLEFYNQYYKDFLYHYYFISKMNIMMSELQKENRELEVPNYNDLNNAFYDYYNGSGRNDTNFNTIKGYYDSYKDLFDGLLKNYYAKEAAEEICMAYENGDYSLFDKNFLDINYSDAVEIRGQLTLTEELASKFHQYAKDYLTKKKGYEDKDYELPTDEVINKKLDFKVAAKYYLETDTDNYELTPIGYTDSSYILSVYYLKTVTSLYNNIRLQYYTSDYEESINAKYDVAITITDYSQAQLKQLLQSFPTYRYAMTNMVYQRVSAIVSTIDTMQKIFLIIGIVFAVFASLMLFNFISSSISSKTKEIGILRAIGTRGSDLFKIFFSESGIISIVCFTIAIAASIAICIVINNNLSTGLGIKLLNFNYINALIIVGGSFVIALIGTFIPVFIASKKAPIESIRTL